MSNNWGRWGEKDERGTLNLLTPDVVLKAVGAVRTGEVLCLGAPVHVSAMPIYPGRTPPNHFMSVDGGDWAMRSPGDRVEFADDYLGTHTHNGTHIDALAHVWAGGKLYNGFSRNAVRSNGAKLCDIGKVGGIVARGVLLDVAAYLGVDHLDDTHTITPDELAGCARAQETELRPGDAVVIRTGWQRVFKTDPDRFYRNQPGIGVAAAEYLAKLDPAVIGADNLSVERMPWEGDDPERPMPAHVVLLRDHGIHLVELLKLEELASRGRHEFLLVIAPLRIPGGVGSNVNPLAVL